MQLLISLPILTLLVVFLTNHLSLTPQWPPSDLRVVTSMVVSMVGLLLSYCLISTWKLKWVFISHFLFLCYSKYPQNFPSFQSESQSLQCSTQSAASFLFWSTLPLLIPTSPTGICYSLNRNTHASFAGVCVNFSLCLECPSLKKPQSFPYHLL